VEATEATCTGTALADGGGGCTYNNVVDFSSAMVTHLTTTDNVGSRHACELYDVTDSTAGTVQANTANTWVASGTGTWSADLTACNLITDETDCINGGDTNGCGDWDASRAAGDRCRPYQCRVTGGTGVSYQTACTDLTGFTHRVQDGTAKCFDFVNGGGADTTGYMTEAEVCQMQNTGRTWTDGGGTDLVIKGQDAGGSDVSSGAGGDVVLRPGSPSSGGAAGAVEFQDASGNVVMEVSAASGSGQVHVPAGKSLNVEGTLESAGTYVAEPASSAVSIQAHGDAISGAKVSNNVGTLVYADLTKEFVVLNCDNLNADMRDVLNPVFPRGTNGQIVHVINTGEDYCQMQRGGPSQADFDAKFRLIGDTNKICLKSSADGGGIISFMYYYAAGVGGWQQLTSAPTEC
jgi:hypothetical protein